MIQFDREYMEYDVISSLERHENHLVVKYATSIITMNFLNTSQLPIEKLSVHLNLLDSDEFDGHFRYDGANDNEVNRLKSILGRSSMNILNHFNQNQLLKELTFSFEFALIPDVFDRNVGNIDKFVERLSTQVFQHLRRADMRVTDNHRFEYSCLRYSFFFFDRNRET